MAMPMIPYISDSIENMQRLIIEAKRSDAEFVLFGGMTLKPGRQKRHFLDTVSKFDPEKLDQVKEVYSNENSYGMPEWSKVPQNVMTLGHHICRKERVNPRSVRHRCPDEYESNHRVLQILLDIQYWMSMFLNRSKREWKDIHTLTVKIEKGLPDLQNAMEQGKLESIVGSKINSVVSEIIQTGTCELYRQTLEKVDQISLVEYEKTIS